MQLLTLGEQAGGVLYPLRMNVHVVTTKYLLRIWMYDCMEVNRQMGSSFWLENLVKKCA
jgi:hypothetical protein